MTRVEQISKKVGLAPGSLVHVGDQQRHEIAKPDPKTLRKIQKLKREIMHVRKAVWPMRDVTNALLRSESERLDETEKLYLKDVYDHVVHASDLIDTYRDIAAGLMDSYLSLVSFKMNEVMKVLTIIATIFIPLGFIAGLYGMNFDTKSPWNMPELRCPFGYVFALALMLAVAVALLFFFRRKGWIGSPRPPSDARRGP